jgi:uncharacterized protein YcfL
MLKKWLAPAFITTLLIVTGCSSHKSEKKEKVAEASVPAPVTQASLSRLTETWPQSSKAAIASLTAKYGLPTSVTEEMVIWSNTVPFKRSVVYKEEVTHQFPMQHSDILLQTVDYRVPKDKVAQLSKFDGSLIIDRTKGELSARNEKEEMNILALNLADKIVRGQLSAEQARREYSKDADAFAAGTSSQLITGLNFKTVGNTSDPDTMMQSQEAKGSKSKAFESNTVDKVIEDQK